MGNKTAFGLLFGIVALVAMFAVCAVSAQNEVYLVPQHSNASFCNTVEAQIWANTTDTFGAGQINLTYSHCCANVTNLEYDSLWQGTWDSSIDGREWLVFIRPLGLPTVNGTVLIGNLTIHCCNESKCVTSLTFSSPGKLSDPIVGDLTVTWIDETFTCLALTPVPTPSLPPGPRDSDGDGYSDIDEMLAGTDPNDPNSYPGAPAVTPTPVVTPTPTPTATPTAPTEEKFRVAPTVVLRPVVDVIEKGQDGIVELYMDNPSLNDVVLHLEAHIMVPAGLHIYSEQYAWATAAGVAYAPAFEIPPGTARTISIHIKADKTARTGQHTLHFSGLYYPGNNKDLYNPISLTYPVTVKEPSMEVPTPIPTPEVPGFEAVFAIAVLLAVAYLLRRK